jgi:hypothetical protein
VGSSALGMLCVGVVEELRFGHADLHFCSLRCFKDFFASVAAELKK